MQVVRDRALICIESDFSGFSSAMLAKDASVDSTKCATSETLRRLAGTPVPDGYRGRRSARDLSLWADCQLSES